MEARACSAVHTCLSEKDAKLVLDKGVPRFYIMRLEKRGLSFGTIVHHAKVTQCLGSTQGHAWYMAVAKSDVKTPSAENMRAFRIPPGVYIKLHCGTWHVTAFLTAFTAF